MTLLPSGDAVTWARRLGLFAALCLLLLGCGSEASTAVASASTQALAPTPVATTAPLSLPPAHPELPALAALPASDATTAAAPNAAPEPAPNRDADVEAATDSAAASQEALPTPTTAAPVTTAGTASVTSADRWSECVVAAAQTTGATALLDPISDGAPIDMSSLQLNSLASASVACDPATASLSESAVVDYLPSAASCLNAWLDSSGGGSVFVGLASIGWNQPTPTWAQAHLINALDDCFTGAPLAADVMGVVSANTTLTGAFDAACLAASFDSSGTMRGYAQALASDPTTASLNVRLSDAWVLNCANVGQMVAAAAAADGVGLSGSTVSCIDSELKGSGAISQLLAGTADTDAIGIATIACLTDAEATALLG